MYDSFRSRKFRKYTTLARGSMQLIQLASVMLCRVNRGDKF